MKVICVHEVTRRHDTGESWPSPIKEGEYYTVISEQNWNGKTYYTLSEIPEVDIQAECFAPLSQIDETTFSRNYKKETV